MLLINLNFSRPLERAITMNLDGYITFKALPEELTHAIHVIHSGKKYYDSDVLHALMQTQREMNGIIEDLTLKEKEVLKSLGMGFSNKMISEHLFITENTVKKHVSQILSKLNLVNRTQAALYANEREIVRFKHDVSV